MLIDALPCTRHERVTVSTRLLPFLRGLLFFWVMVPSTGCVWLEAALCLLLSRRGFIHPWQAHSFLLGQLNVGSPGVVLASFLLL